LAGKHTPSESHLYSRTIATIPPNGLHWLDRGETKQQGKAGVIGSAIKYFFLLSPFTPLLSCTNLFFTVHKAYRVHWLIGMFIFVTSNVGSMLLFSQPPAWQFGMYNMYYRSTMHIQSIKPNYDQKII
jgi:hypothetical protein